MAPLRGPVAGGRGRAPLTNKYRNITNQRTVQGVLRSGGPLTGSASGVRSISSVDAFNTLGQFFIGEALGLGFAAGAAKVFGFAAPKIGRAVSGARPMTVAERSAAVTRAGRTGVGYIGQGNFRALQGSSYMGKSRYDLVFDEATRIAQSRRPSPAFSEAPAYLRRSGVSPNVAAQAKQALYERQSQWAMIGGKLRNVDRVYEGARDYLAAGPRKKIGWKNKKGPKK